MIENGIQSCTIQRKDQLKLILKESDAVVLVVEAKIQVEIEWSGSTNEILEHHEKKHKE